VQVASARLAAELSAAEATALAHAARAAAEQGASRAALVASEAAAWAACEAERQAVADDRAAVRAVFKIQRERCIRGFARARRRGLPSELLSLLFLSLSLQYINLSHLF
jgi:hypothetical protein